MLENEGKEAEKRASLHLQSLGFHILTCNFHSKFGEIDIIALKDNILHFCEVKFSKNYDPLERITPSKMAKMTKTIQYYFLKHPQIHDYQMDAIIVRPQGIEIIKNISY
jgi:putative endonuclease